jgi:glycosyltransferase involved in cell wall biosynthesis
MNQIVICRSNPIAPDPRVEKIARSLCGAGYAVSAVGWDRSVKLPAEEYMNGLQVTRLRIPARYGSGLMNLPALLAWQIGLLVWLVSHRRAYQIIHACDFDTILPALFCKFFWRKTVVYDIFDFYADHLRRTPGFLKEMIRRADFWAIEKADGVILVDDARFEQIWGSRPKRAIAVYNSPGDEAGYVGAAAEPIPDPVVYALRIAYVGLLQVERGLYEMIRVLQCHPEWRLDLAGFGGDEKEIVSLVEPMPNIFWHGRVSYDRALALSREADVLFATYDPVIPNHRYSSPNKVFEAMMLGKPVIVAENTNMDRIINESNCGIVVRYGDETALEEALSNLATDEEVRSRLGRNARRAYEEVYSWQKMDLRLKDFYRQILLTK